MVAPQRTHWCSIWVPSAATVIPVIVHTCSTQAGASSSLTATVSQPEEGHAMPKKLVTEATDGAVGEVTEKGVVPIVVASPGWGSSGWYGKQVLENAVQSRVFAAGTHLYLDHPGEAERYDRPERSVRDLVAVLEADAAWDPQQGIVAQAKIFAPYRDLFRDEAFVSAIGVSLRATADTTVGEAEGRKGTIITELIEARSIDFVTKAGRGGKILSVLESARAAAVEEARNVGHWVESRLHLALTQIGDEMFGDGRLTREERIALSGAVGDALTAFSGALEQSQPQLYTRDPWAQPEPLTDAAESGPIHVPAPAGRPTPTPKSQEDTMGTIQVDEAEHGRLTEAAGRVTALESERAQAIAERDEAREALAVERRTAAAARIVDESNTGFTALERRGLLAELPVTAEGALDVDAFTATVTEAAATRAEAGGAGSVRGFGATTGGDSTVTAKESTASVLGAFGIPNSQEG